MENKQNTWIGLVVYMSYSFLRLVCMSVQLLSVSQDQTDIDHSWSYNRYTNANTNSRSTNVQEPERRNVTLNLHTKYMIKQNINFLVTLTWEKIHSKQINDSALAATQLCKQSKEWSSNPTEPDKENQVSSWATIQCCLSRKLWNCSCPSQNCTSPY